MFQDDLEGSDHGLPVQKLDRTVTTARAVVCDLGSRGITIARHEHASPLAVLRPRYRAGWINRHQQEIIDYLVEENRVLKGQLRGRRLRLTDDERRRLAVKGKALGRSVLETVATIVTPDTIMSWYRRLVARKWDYSSRRKKPGCPRIETEISDLILRRARENSRWGYTRIKGALVELGHEVSRGNDREHPQ